MNDPRQYLVHLTNRGSKVSSQSEGNVGQFQCYTSQPMKDINKFGLINYSIPKTLDTLDINNRTFEIELHYKMGGGSVIIPVTLPFLDYYNMVAGQRFDLSVDQKGTVQTAPTAAGALSSGAALSRETGSNHPDGRLKDVLAFDEVLQVTINWAIQKAWRAAYVDAGANPVEPRLNALSRLSCIVKMEDGCYQFYFGYRGHGGGVQDAPFESNPAFGGANDTAHEEQRYTGTACDTGSGMPGHTVAVGGLVGASANGEYTFTDVTGAPHPNHVVFNNAMTNDAAASIALRQWSFNGLSARLQMFIGASHPNIFTDTKGVDPNQSITRGWVRLCNYTLAAVDNINTEVIKMEMPVPPNLDPPSFLLLNLTAQGTRTKVLGHDNEKGGWAIPTPPAFYKSRFDNLPNGRFYDSLAARTMPVATAGTETEKRLAWQAHFACDGDGNKQRPGSGLGYNFDCIPQAALSYANSMYNNDNFALMQRGAIEPSRHIIFRDATRRYLRGSGQRGGASSQGYGTGHRKQSSVFTVSMIEPNWIHCTVEDSTVQTLDVQLAWGDTSEPVNTDAGNPVQFSIIASP